ncbi:MAG: GNAT family N-acetyltransferase [Eubacteriales bacterium]|nr:GNAT family N-acetyltransferase [Eubacteriales bacterium]
MDTQIEKEVKIRKAAKSDSKDISSLIIATLLQSNSSDYCEDEIARLCAAHSCSDITDMIATKELLVAEKNERIAGCIALVFAEQEPGTALVTTVFVHPGFQGQGIGKLLMSFAEEVTQGRNIRTLKLYSSITAHSFYIKLGYKDISGSIPALTDDDIFAMSKSIV